MVMDKVLALEAALREMPQADLPTSHLFSGGMYARVMELKKGTTIVGKVHKREHFFILAAGTLAVTVDGEAAVMTAPQVLVGKPGVKRAGHALEDCTCINVHKTDYTDLDEIEAEQIEPDPLALFDSANRMKELTMTEVLE